MFYNHEVLTSRKYGIATIWLVATLGSKSTLRKINRKAIFEVHIVKACETIVAPEVPMALRLQSSLLFGVTRVYDQQCTFVLTEAQTMQNDLKRAIRTIPSLELDAEARKAARPEQLLLQDDPNFMPGLAFANLEFDLDMDNLGLTTDDSSQNSNLLSPHTPRSSQSSNGPLPQIVIPSSHSGHVGVIGDYVHGAEDSRAGRISGYGSGFVKEANQVQNPLTLSSGLSRFQEEIGLLDEPGFTFDVEGNLIENDVVEQTLKAQTDEPFDPTRPRRESSLLAHVREEHQAAQRTGLDANDAMDIDYIPPQQDEEVLPAGAEPFAPWARPDVSTQEAGYDLPHASISGEVQQHEGSPVAVVAAQSRRPRAVKVLQIDNELQISSVNIKNWERDYLSNMDKAAAHRASIRAPLLAKKKADYMVWTMGIGGVGAHLSDTNIASPLDIFYGDNLLAILSGDFPLPNARKRDHSSLDGESTGSEGRRVRSRPSSTDDVARGIGEINMDEGDLNIAMDDEDVEVGRNAPTPLPGDVGGDPSSVMPWNRSASQRSTGIPGSAIPFGHATGPMSRRVSISSATPLRGGPFGRRTMSASPLIGHGQPDIHQPVFGSLGGPSSSAGGDAAFGDHFNDAAEAGDELGALNTQEEFELFGPAAEVDTQTAGQSQWMKKALDTESANFLDFVESSIGEQQEQGAGAAGRSEISFESLLKPSLNSKVVAAQALLHCLTLATRNMIHIRQDQGFGEIVLGLASGGNGISVVKTQG